MILVITLIILLILGLWVFIVERANQIRFSSNMVTMFKIKSMNPDELIETMKKQLKESQEKDEYEKQHPVMAKIKEWREYYCI